MENADDLQSIMLLAKKGNPQAQLNLARRLWKGDSGAVRNRNEAIKWFRTAAKHGGAEEQMAFGLMMCWELDPPKHFAEGLTWIERAAESGHTGAQYFLGVEYATGENIGKNSSLAAAWYKRAAELGHAEAQYNLSLMLFDGEGVSKDIEQAHRWLLTSAENGELLALRQIWLAYRKGLMGFVADASKATFWQDKYERAKQL